MIISLGDTTCAALKINYIIRVVSQNSMSDTRDIQLLDGNRYTCFITLAYAELREVFLRRAADIRSLKPVDIGFSELDGLRIDVY